MKSDDTKLRDIADAVRRALTVPMLVRALRLEERSKRQARGASVLCPWHAERDPSCSITAANDGGIRVRCHACGVSSDAFGLIAQVRGTGLRGRQWVETLRAACEIAGMHSQLDELGESRRRPHQEPVRAALPPVSFPDPGELRDLWDTSRVVSECEGETREWLETRGIDPERCPGRVISAPVTRLRSVGIAREVVDTLDPSVRVSATRLPPWARWKGERPRALTWAETGHRLILPTFDASGKWRSVRACRVSDAYAPDSPKRLPPSGHTTAGLVLATIAAVRLLRGKHDTREVLIVEGEPDWLTWATRAPDAAVFGIFSGAWTKQFGDRILPGSVVYLRCHADAAGKRYQSDVARTLPHAEVRVCA